MLNQVRRAAFRFSSVTSENGEVARFESRSKRPETTDSQFSGKRNSILPFSKLDEAMRCATTKTLQLVDQCLERCCRDASGSRKTLGGRLDLTLEFLQIGGSLGQQRCNKVAALLFVSVCLSALVSPS